MAPPIPRTSQYDCTDVSSIIKLKGDIPTAEALARRCNSQKGFISVAWAYVNSGDLVKAESMLKEITDNKVVEKITNAIVNKYLDRGDPASINKAYSMAKGNPNCIKAKISIETNPKEKLKLKIDLVAALRAELYGSKIMTDSKLDKRLWLAGALMGLGEYALAIEEYNSALPLAEKEQKNNPKSYKDIINLANTLTGLGQALSITNRIGEQENAKKRITDSLKYYREQLKPAIDAGKKEIPTIPGKSQKENKEFYIQALLSYKSALHIMADATKKEDAKSALKKELKLVREKLNSLGVKNTISEEAGLLIEANKPREAINLLLTDLHKMIKPNSPDYDIVEITNDISNLAWAYEEAKDYKEAAAIYNALLSNLKTNIANVKPVIDFINGEDRTNKSKTSAATIRALRPPEYSEGMLMLKLARVYRQLARKEKSEEYMKKAERMYTDAKAIFKKEEDTLTVECIAVEEMCAKAFYADAQMKAKDYTNALTTIGTKPEQIEKLLDNLKQRVTEAFLFEAYSSVVWLYSIRAQATEARDGKGTDSKDYLKAAELIGGSIAKSKIPASELNKVKHLFENLDSVTSEPTDFFTLKPNITIDDIKNLSTTDGVKKSLQKAMGKLFSASGNTLSSMKLEDENNRPMTKDDLRLMKAGLLQGAGEKEASKLEEALSLYNDVIKNIGEKPNDQQKSNYSQARIGKAEVLLAKVKIIISQDTKTDQDKALAKSLVAEAIQLLGNARETAGFGKIDEKKSEDMKRLMQAIYWALGTSVQIQKKLDEKPLKEGTISNEQALLLVLTRIAAKGFDQKDYETGRWQEIYEQAIQADLGAQIKPSDIIDFAKVKKTSTTDTKWKITADYASNLLDAEFYTEALAEYASISVEMDEAQKKAKGEELLNIANFKVSLASTLWYKLGQAQADAAASVLQTALDGIDKTSKKGIELYVRAYSIQADIFARSGKNKEAIAKLDEILKLFSSEAKFKTPLNIENILKNYKDYLDPKDLGFGKIKILLPVLLSLGDIYNYGEKAKKEAKTFYKIAGTWARHIPDSGEKKKGLAQSCLGLANVFRLRDNNNDEAIKFFTLGINVLEEMGVDNLDSTAKKTLIDLYEGKASTLAKIGGKSGEIEKIMDYVDTIVVKLREDDKKTAKETADNIRIAIKKNQIDRAVTLSSGISWTKESYFAGNNKESSSSGYTFFADLRVPIVINPITLTFGARYTQEFERKPDLGRPTGLIDGVYDRLTIHPPRKFDIAVSANIPVLDDLDLNVATGLNITTAGFRLGQFSWDPSFTQITGRDYKEETFVSISPNMNLGLTYRLPHDVSTGIDVRSSYLASGSATPLSEAQKQINSEGLYDKKHDAPEPAKEADGWERLSVEARVFASIAHRFTLADGWYLNVSPTLGVGGGYNPQEVLANGLWPLSGQKFARAYGYGGLNGELFIKRNVSIVTDLEIKKGVQITDDFSNPFSVSAQLGINWFAHSQFNAGASAGVTVSEDPVLHSRRTNYDLLKLKLSF